jgi:hypothetical protein
MSRLCFLLNELLRLLDACDDRAREGTSNMTEKFLLDRIKFRGIGGIMGNTYFNVQGIRQFLEVFLKKVRSARIASSTI